MMISNDPSWFAPDWPAPLRVRCLSTTRWGGVSRGHYASFNLADHVGDDPCAVAENRTKLAEEVGAELLWLRQVHGTRVIDAAASMPGREEADASLVRHAGVACVVMTADCLPVLFCDREGRVVAAAHAGWRGLLAGVLEATVAAMKVPAGDVMAWFGPAIGPASFEVGEEVREAFVAAFPDSATAFVAGKSGKWLADIYMLARQRLQRAGVTRIFGGTCCTVRDGDRFFSYRRDGQTGRMATAIWLER